MTRWLLLLLVVASVACGDDDTPPVDASTNDASPNDASPNDASNDAPTSMTDAGGDAAPDADDSDADVAEMDAGSDASWRDAQLDAQVDAEADAQDAQLPGADASDVRTLTCDPGFEVVATACVDINECLTDNGGCDLVTQCTNSEGAFACGGCAMGYVGDAINGCVPRLASLGVNEAPIEPAFDPEQTAYSAQVGLNEATIRVEVAALALGAVVAINDVVVTNGQASVALDVGDNTLNVTVEGTNGRVHTYVLTVNRAPTVLPHAYLKASNANGLDRFGHAIALSGDTLVVGAPGEDSNATGVNGNQGNDGQRLASGAAYVFVRDGNRWVQQAYLKASSTRANDAFGTSVAIDGDTVVVGAPNQDSGAGAVYVFTRGAGGWSQQAYLQATLNGNGDHFGRSVALSGNTLVVGAPDEDGDGEGVNQDPASNAEVESGAAYVFVRDGGAWSQQAYLKASHGDAGDAFGTAVVIDGEVLAVGATGEASNGVAMDPELDNSASGSGAVYVFRRDQGTWAQTAWLKAPNADGQDWFGAALSLDGDRLVVGAPNEASATGAPEDNSAAACGAVYVFTFESDAWGVPTYVKSENAGGGDRFGTSVGLDGTTLLVGAPGEDGSGAGVNPGAPFGPESNGSADSGAAFLFVQDGGTWSQSAYLKSFAAEYAVFLFQIGASVAIDGGHVAVAAVGDSSSAAGVNPPMPAPFNTPEAGSVSIFR